MAPWIVLAVWVVVTLTLRWLETTDTRIGRRLKADTQLAYEHTIVEHERELRRLRDSLARGRGKLEQRFLEQAVDDMCSKIEYVHTYATQHGLTRHVSESSM